jgi:hypothetical protein
VDFRHGNLYIQELINQEGNKPMLDQYKNVPRFSNVFIAEQRDFIDRNEMAQAIEDDAAEPRAYVAWRRIRNNHSTMRGIIDKIRFCRASIAAGGYIRDFMQSGGIKASGKATQADLDSALRDLNERRIMHRLYWVQLRCAEQQDEYERQKGKLTL